MNRNIVLLLQNFAAVSIVDPALATINLNRCRLRWACTETSTASWRLRCRTTHVSAATLCFPVILPRRQNYNKENRPTRIMRMSIALPTAEE